MKKFIALYYNTSGSHTPPPPMSEEEMKAMMAPWGDWQAKYGDRVVDMGAPLTQANSSSNGSNWSDSKNVVTGYSIVAADSLEAAKEMFVGHPVYSYPGHSVELSEFASM